MKASKESISQDSLEKLCICLMQLTSEDGLLLNINPAEALQDWLLKMYPQHLQDFWLGKHSYIVKASEK